MNDITKDEWLDFLREQYEKFYISINPDNIIMSPGFVDDLNEFVNGKVQNRGIA